MLSSSSKLLRLQRKAVPAGKVKFYSPFRVLSGSKTIGSQRAIHDLVTPVPNKPIISSGIPGYSAVSGHIVTVFGCTGFLGRYLVSKLGASHNKYL